jgi:hypothetical protein
MKIPTFIPLSHVASRDVAVNPLSLPGIDFKLRFSHADLLSCNARQGRQMSLSLNEYPLHVTFTDSQGSAG